MKKVLFILGELSDDDIDWMIDTAATEEISAGTVLIQEGQPIDALYIVLSGTLKVLVESLGGKEVARLSTGEVVGEMSFVDARPPSATVKAIEDSLVISIPRQQLAAKLQQDVGFASRFYRALAIFLSDRLRGTVSRLGYGKDSPLENPSGKENEPNPNMLDNLTLAGARFDWLLRRLRSISPKS
ncbi:cyclic nucleotide-binding protein [Leptolyngbya sp. 'hensonii']|uniref:cyclic nucleotide-binding domain-containing protein n=1 Tax=Leptolyngbya sp. 'hensonii' TaxID=1922337 RepID=UPI00094FF5C8|nr:cyclic nucleotide-binding domain-containing protein [Leptolyngbya sp. 'hensonii']OLP20187.1 cyclic nucleotide-binding protein [Leptolyngbya sp. 'hensonii']